MNILAIVKSIDGGTGTFLIDLLKVNTGKYGDMNLKVLALEKPSFRTGDFSDFIFLNKKSFYPQKYSLAPKNFSNMVNELLWIQENINSFKPDILLGVDFRCNILVMIMKFLNRKLKTILTTHIDLASLTLQRSNYIIKRFFKFIVKGAYERADCLVSVSKSLAINLKRDFDIKKKVITIYNGKSLPLSKPRKFSINKKKIILSVARLSIQKDYPTLINSIKILSQGYNNFELHIASDGPEKNSLKRKVIELGLENKIKFLGWVKNLDKILDRADIFILSSKAEGFGYVILEAMSHSLPVVSTDTPYGPSEILEGGKFGKLVPVGDEELMAKTLLGLLKSKNEYEKFSKRSAKRAAYFSEDKMLHEYSKLFLRLTKSPT